MLQSLEENGFLEMEVGIKETANEITMGDRPVTLLGHALKVGDKATDFTVVANDLSTVRFSEISKGKVTLISVVPSLDTPVCDLQTTRFNEEASKLGNDVQVITISMDLPFAQKRWCAAAGIDKIHVFSDHRDASFGISYGVLMKEPRLLARSIFVVDKKGTIRYRELVKEVTNHPDYDAALAAVKELLEKQGGAEC
jgi:thiol peroxidase